MTAAAAGAVAVAIVLDAALAEPPTRFHPVAWFGSLVASFDREWVRPRLAGAVAAVALPLLAAGVVALAVALARRVFPLAGVLVAGVALFSTTSLRRLVAKAAEVAAATETDLPTARERLRWLAGRDATHLSAGEVRSAAVESAAENLTDGLVAPLLAFALLAPASVALAAGAAAWVKAVNTVDSMVGYPHKPHGGAGARLDDLVMWVPARASAGLLALGALAVRDADAARPRPLAALRAAREWAGVPASPNSGWPMATLAALLDVRLEKPGAYALNPGAPLPTLADARGGVRIVGVAGLLSFLLAGVVAWP
ncbi:adenosylcobinamide-phosphate synthase CbiB [Halorussus marinus]|uniref:adenosylcobinamide-phosphate synthase CbiB n=1 Tax=Halorussus marinus TaxID=2505976 RepID=UPI00106EBF29|nr:adenosylcobinamide-phosphate synthase CbiB [Halorussus marinus]